MGEAAYRIGAIERAIDVDRFVRKVTVGIMNEQGWWAKFHDATLVGFVYDWRSSSLVFEVKLRGVPVKIACEELDLLFLSRRQPWGPSVSINGIEAELSGAGV